MRDLGNILLLVRRKLCLHRTKSEVPVSQIRKIDNDIVQLKLNGVKNIRNNQQQVDINGMHYNIEYDTTTKGSLKHQNEIPINDLNARNTFWKIDENGNKITGAMPLDMYIDKFEYIVFSTSPSNEPLCINKNTNEIFLFSHDPLKYEKVYNDFNDYLISEIISIQKLFGYIKFKNSEDNIHQPY
jgi:hypothetical protein